MDGCSQTAETFPTTRARAGVTSSGGQEHETHQKTARVELESCSPPKLDFLVRSNRHLCPNAPRGCSAVVYCNSNTCTKHTTTRTMATKKQSAVGSWRWRGPSPLPAALWLSLVRPAMWFCSLHLVACIHPNRLCGIIQQHPSTRDLPCNYPRV